MRPMLISSIVALAMLSATHALGQELQRCREVFLSNCAVCHTSLSPKIGDKDAWAPFLKTGEKALVASVINGGGSMAPRAGRPDLSDNDIRAAVQYIISKAK